MSIRLISLETFEYYHIYNRGNSKQIIFNDKQDYNYFTNLLSIMNTEKHLKTRDNNTFESKNKQIISIGAYCLMPNHFHILLRQEKENGITTFLLKISTAYVMYYNKKYKHSGSLFEGKFKSKHASKDTYLKYLFSYIHLNPLKLIDPDWKSKTKNISHIKLDFLYKYPYSSFNEYYKDKQSLVRKESFPNYFPTNKSFVKEINSWFSIEHD